MVNVTSIAILLLALVANAYGRINLRRNNVAVNVGFQLPGARLLGALAKLPFSVQYVPDGLQAPPPPLQHTHGPEGGEHGHPDERGVHHHHHYHGLEEAALQHSIGPEFGGFGNEVGYNEVYRR